MSEKVPPPPGVLPLFLRGVTAEKYGFKNGEGIMDLVDMLLLKKEDVMKEIQGLGVMSDFEPAKKQIDSYPGEEVLFVIDKKQVYGEVFLCCYTEAAKEEYMSKVREAQEAIEAQARAEAEAEQARLAAEFARLNQVYEDKPMTPRGWMSHTSVETDQEVQEMTFVPARGRVVQEISRPKKLLKQPFRLLDRDAVVGGVAEYRSAKDPNFKPLREADIGFQAAPACVEAGAQTNWNRPVNKAIQYETAGMGVEPTEGEAKDVFFSFLERAIMNVEIALQQNESVDIFNETFQIAGEDEAQDGAQAEGELRELKNFADPTYSKSKALVAIDWLPKTQGMLAVSAVKNISFEQRTALSGLTSSSYILLWDFKQLVRPAALLQCHHEVLCFRFNRTTHGLAAGGCATGQVVLWDIAPKLAAAARKGKGGGGASGAAAGADGAAGADAEEEDRTSMQIAPKYISSVDHSHKKFVSDVFWLPPNTQVNFRGQLVGQEHLDGKSHQFVTVAGDGMVMVWDIRYEQIANDELRFIGKSKHVPVDKAASKADKEAGNVKLLWAPIFKAPLKRLDGVGELSLSKVCYSGNLRPAVAEKTTLAGDFRSHLIIGTEEGDILHADLCVPKSAGHGAKEGDEDEDREEGVREFVTWCRPDHARPAVSMEQSPFFPDIVLTVSDWGFNIWKTGQDKPLFTSPLSHTYLTAGAWSPTRPAVVLVSRADGHIIGWDFTDSSSRPSYELKATHARVTTIEFLASGVSNTRQQLLAVGDETGTLHVFEVPRALVRPGPKEEALMTTFFDREQQRAEYVKSIPEIEGFTSLTHAPGAHGEAKKTDARGVTAPATAANKSQPATAVAGAGAPPASDASLEDVDPAGKALREAQKKEEEDFLKAEAAFIAEMGLAVDDLPAGIKATYAGKEEVSTKK